ncbi:hypothetical protein C9J03_13440 [Photobacterium gaetbulicola]|uniref:Uncharacterized protein n=1 Tax=Photobacterium gaetbulicola Gung47 TaxID=658445 RepID=A0A0C5W4H9_9GAMM|nr:MULTISPECIES: hypothetical protein [Photobacterium]AJR06341.1 hypothetical protein H744_1c1318 [Photobacterium gaetbulicola Gung47]PSU08720.1 hypothetical protein C9J03_13440 [Photobacterium gaetbulicola]WEM45225.1 hypothetical protein PTW35_19250 [Photobacterium sp. DA100]
MIRTYARLSKDRPFIHVINVTVTILVFVFCCYQLLANERITFSLGFIYVAFMVTLFSKAFAYRQKYLCHE